MEEEKMMIGFRGISQCEEQAYSYGLVQVTDKTLTCFSGNLLETKKVANMVGTFLKKDRDGFQVSAIKVESEKVTNMVGTFLKKQRYGFQVLTNKVELEKFTNMVGTFLKEDRNGFHV